MVGSRFQNLGAAQLNDLSARVFLGLFVGKVNKTAESSLRLKLYLDARIFGRSRRNATIFSCQSIFGCTRRKNNLKCSNFRISGGSFPVQRLVIRPIRVNWYLKLGPLPERFNSNFPTVRQTCLFIWSLIQ